MTERLDLNQVQAQLGLGKADFAKAMGVHYQTMVKWQRQGLPDGRKHPDVADTMARLLLWLHGRGLLQEWTKIVDTTDRSET